MSLLLSVTSILMSLDASAIPAFARKENVGCIMCHTNGAAPHLTEFGYLYRRMAFHWPGKLGDEKRDEEGMNTTKHMAAGINVGYAYTDNVSGSGSTFNKSVNSNGIVLPEVELWPLVGGFLGNFGTWSEIDGDATGSLNMSMADVRYATGSTDMFFNMRAGIISPEGYAASDQWFTDANTPLMEKISAVQNIGGNVQDTIATPWGAMGSPELGVELGFNYKGAHLTLGFYDGFSSNFVSSAGTNNVSIGSTGVLPVAQANTGTNIFDNGMRDVRLQYDQFLGDYGAITLGYYNGAVPLTDPVSGLGQTAATPYAWNDHYSQYRAYLSYFAIPAKLDILAGAGWTESQYAYNSPTPDGTFEAKGGFVGVLYHATPHLSLGIRGDKFYYNSTDSATGYSLQASLPYGNYEWNIHFNSTASTLVNTSANLAAGMNTDSGIILRFLL